MALRPLGGRQLASTKYVPLFCRSSAALKGSIALFCYWMPNVTANEQIGLLGLGGAVEVMVAVQVA